MRPLWGEQTVAVAVTIGYNLDINMPLKNNFFMSGLA